MRLPRYQRYSDSGIPWAGEVPEHWQIKPLLAVARERCESNEGMIESNLLSLSYGRIVPKDIEANDGLLPESFETYQVVHAGDVVFRLTDLQNDKRSLRTAIARERGIITSAYLVAQPAEIAAEYLAALLRAYDVAKVFYSMGGGLRQSMKFSDLKRLPVLLPSTEEQAEIIAFLAIETARIDELISEQQRLIELLKEKRQAVISHAVTKGLDPDARMKPSSIEWLGDIPANWSIRRLKHISPFITVGIVVNPSSYIAEEGLPFIYGGDIREGAINWENARRISENASNGNEKTKLLPGDLLTVRVGAPGVTAVVPPECAGGNCASVMLIRQGPFNSDWLCYAMNTRIVRFQVEIVQYGAAQEQFNISHAVNFWVPEPPHSEQDQIAVFLTRETTKIDRLAADAERAIDLLQERRSALISAAVTGKIDVRQAVLEPIA